MTEAAVLDGRYRLIERIGVGGMSVVWRGHDDVLARPVAIKVLADSLTGAPTVDVIRREATAIARIIHPGIAGVYDYGEGVGPGGVVLPYIVMELVNGPSLAQMLYGGPLPWRTAADIGAQVAAALAAAHQYGIVHRDVTPSNIMVGADGVKMIDFGIAAPAGQAPDALLFGTPAYLAPERLGNGVTNPATDVYGLGLVLYQMISGHLPWPSETTTRMLADHRYVAPAPLPPVPGLPPHLAELCRRALEVDPAVRPSSARIAVELAAIAQVGDRQTRTLTRIEAAGGPTGTRYLPAPGPADAVRRGRKAFVLPALLLAVLLIGLAIAFLHQSDHAVARPGPSPTYVLPSQAEPTRAQPTQPAPTQSAPTQPAPTQPAPTQAQAAPAQPTATPDGAACAIDYRAPAQWIFGFEAQVTIVNSGATTIRDWTLRFDLPDGQQLTGGWSGEWHQSGTSVTVRDAGYNASIPAGGSLVIGFIGTASRDRSGTPERFTLNGSTCTR